MNVQIVGTMLDPSGGEPAGGAMIQFIALAQYGGVPKGAQSTQTTSATGEYDFPLNYGRYSLSINHSGRFVNQAVSVTVNDESPSVMDIDLLLQSSVPLTPPEIKYIEELTEQAKQAADDAEGFASDAAYQVSLAEGEVVKATNQANIAGIEADRAKTEADRASEITGLDTVEDAVDMALGEFAGMMSESEARAINRINEAKYDASGMVHMGKQTGDSYWSVNEGLWGHPNAGFIRMGTQVAPITGSSKTDFAMTHIAGSVINIIKMGTTANYGEFELPEAEDGTRIYDSTGDARGSGKASLDLKVDVDPKYGDVPTGTEAQILREAVGRAFEGRVKNGDFRNGTDNWGARGGATRTVADGVMTVTDTNGAADSAATQAISLLEGITYKWSIDVKRDTPGVGNPRLLIEKSGFPSFGGSELSDDWTTISGEYTIPTGASGNWTINLREEGIAVGDSSQFRNFSIGRATEEVVTHPVDLVGLEYYEEELTGVQEVFECIQSLSTTFGDTDVPTVLSTRKLSYFQQYDGQFPEVTADPDFVNDRYRCVVWTDLTDEQKRKVAAYMGEKLFMGVNGNIVNGRLWATTIRGLGNGNWHNIDSTKGNLEFKSGVPVLSRNGHPYVQDTNNKGVFTDGHGCYLYVVATIPKANKGGYHKSLNPYGTRYWQWTQHPTYSNGKWWRWGNGAITSARQCFTPHDSSVDAAGYYISTGSIDYPTFGRDDDVLYDAIYEGGLNGVIDWRLGAVANDSPEEAAKEEAKVENGTYRGVEKLVWTEVWNLTSGGEAYRDESTHEVGTGNASHGRLEVGTNQGVSIGDVMYLVDKTDGEIRKCFVYSVTSGTCNISPVWDSNNNIIKFIDNGFIVWTSNINLSVSGEFMTQMVIADPADFLKVFPDGILGTWCNKIPETGNSGYEATRKVVTGTTLDRLRTADRGVSWVGSGVFGVTAENLVVNVASTGDVIIAPYKAFAKQTKPSAVKPALNATKGLLGVAVTQSHDKAVLAEAVAGIILKSDAGGIVTEQSNPVSFLVDEVIDRITSMTSSMVAPTNGSQAIKFAVYQISDNGQTNLGFIANTMTHNGTSWGELDEIVVPFGSLEVDTFNDANNMLQYAYSTMTAIPTGWTSNHARAGKQVPGVDL